MLPMQFWSSTAIPPSDRLLEPPLPHLIGIGIGAVR